MRNTSGVTSFDTPNDYRKVRKNTMDYANTIAENIRLFVICITYCADLKNIKGLRIEWVVLDLWSMFGFVVKMAFFGQKPSIWSRDLWFYSESSVYYDMIILAKKWHSWRHLAANIEIFGFFLNDVIMTGSDSTPPIHV